MNTLQDKIIQATTSIKDLTGKYGEDVAFSTSFGWEDQVITHLIFSNDLPVTVFTLDTGRLFPETYSVWSATLAKYHKPILVYYPNTDAIQKLVSEKGPNSFYESVENRKECCFIRKVEPLERALLGRRCWITGIRADQSPSRKNMADMEWDDQHQLMKFAPLFDWTLEEVKAFVRQFDVPYNALHDRGFPSIGCQPCTRAVREGEDIRSGRWWWEDQTKKECGLHIHQQQSEEYHK